MLDIARELVPFVVVRMAILAAVAAVAAVASPIASGHPAARPPQERAPLAEKPGERILRVGDTVEGEVTADCGVVHTKAVESSHTQASLRGVRMALEIDTAGPVTIDMRSYLFDAYLVIEGTEGDVIGEDDDGLIRTQARIVTSLEPGRYALLACALNGGVGPFVIEVRPGASMPLQGPARRLAEIQDAQATVDARAAIDPTAPETGEALDRLGFLLWSAGRYAEAEGAMVRALEIAEANFGADDPKTAYALYQLAAQLEGQGRYAEAEPLYVRSLKINESRLGETHLNTAASLNNLADLYKSQGRYRDAEPLYVRSLKTLEDLLGESHEYTTQAMSNLAGLYLCQSRYPEAENLLVRALEIRESRFGGSHPDVADSLNGLANLREMQGRHAEAESLYVRSLEIHESQRGPSHPDTAASLSNLAIVYESQGRYLEAEQLLVRSLHIRESVFGERHPTTATSLIGLASIYSSLGRYSEAEPLYVRSLRIRESELGESHPDTAKAMNGLASLYKYQGRFVEAEPLFIRSLEIRESLLGPSHPDVATALNNLAYLYEAQGRYPDAEPLFVRALRIRESGLRDSHPDIASSLNNLAYLYAHQGRYAEAEPLYVRALAIRETQLGDSHPDTSTSLSNLASLYESQGRYGEAEPLYVRALEICELQHGELHPDTATSLNNLAVLYESQGRYGEAEQLFVRALAIRESGLGDSHPDTANVRQNLAYLYESQGRYPESVALRLRSLDGGQDWVEGQLLLAASDRRLWIADRQTEAVADALSAWFAHADPKPPFDTVYRRICAWKGAALRGASRVSRVMSEAMPSDEELRRLHRELLDIEGRLSVLAYAERIEDAGAHLERVAEQRARRSRVQQEMLTRLGLDRDRRATDGAEFARLLPAGAAVLDFMTHRRWNRNAVEDGAGARAGSWEEPRMLCVVTASGSSEPRLVDLGDASRLEAATDAWLDRVMPGRRGARPEESEVDPGERVRELLLGPIVAALPPDTTRLFVIPDDLLGAVPFDALPLDEDRYLIDAVDVVYATDPVGLRDLLASTTRPIDGAPSILAVGGVDYDSRAGASVAAELGTLARAELREGPTTFARRWGPLSSTAEEVEGLVARAKRTWPATDGTLLLRGREATEEEVKSAVSGRMILHFATHGFFQREGLRSVWEAALARADERPAPRGLGMLRSGSSDRRDRSDPFLAMPKLEGEAPGMLAGLILAGANLDPGSEPDRDDGVLTATEVSSLDLSRCRIAVLSACQTSLGLRRSGEGLQSLRRGFHEAGAATVIASLWKVDDEATQRLMHTFYEELWTNGCGAGEALRRAKLEMMREKRDPYYWGAFTLSGDWR